MKFLLNMNIPPQLCSRFTAVGHECRHVKDCGMSRAEDYEIVQEAKASQETIVTHDLDWGIHTLSTFIGHQALPPAYSSVCRRTVSEPFHGWNWRSSSGSRGCRYRKPRCRGWRNNRSLHGWGLA